MSIKILTAREYYGPKWCREHPDQDHGKLLVLLQKSGRKKVRTIGPDTPENRAKAEQIVELLELRAQWERIRSAA